MTLQGNFPRKLLTWKKLLAVPKLLVCPGPSAVTHIPWQGKERAVLETEAAVPASRDPFQPRVQPAASPGEEEEFLNCSFRL